MKEWLLDALNAIPPQDCDRETLIKIGIALKFEGFDFDIWDAWSTWDETNHRSDLCRKIWDKYEGKPEDYDDLPDREKQKFATGATITYIAQQYGWHPTCDTEENANTFVLPQKPDTDSYIDDLLKCEGVPYLDLIRYLEAVYESDDIVPVITDARLKNGKWGPGQAMFYKRDDLIQSLRETRSVGKAIGGYYKEAGVWIGMNPFDGKWQSQKNVVKFRYTLIECDLDPKTEQPIPFREQLQMLINADLPMAAIICSGGKSIHAVVHIDAVDREQYDARVQFLHQYLIKIAGLPIDNQTKNCNRTPRMPGVIRGGNAQYLIATNWGPESYEEWVHQITHI